MRFTIDTAILASSRSRKERRRMRSATDFATGPGLQRNALHWPRFASTTRIVCQLGLRATSFSLRSYHHRCANVGNLIKLTRFPIRHPNAAVRCGLPWQIALVQSVARRELEKVGHRGAYEVGMRWFGVTPAIDIRFHDTA
jgi:hypothetical protein